MEIAFIVMFGVGLLLLLVTFAIGELFDLGGDVVHEIGGHLDLGGDHGLEAQAGAEASTPSPFSSRLLSVFLTVYGGLGYIFLQMDLPIWTSNVFGILSGVLICFGTYFLIVRPLARQQGDSLVRTGQLIGQVGQVTRLIPEGGVGEVLIVPPGGSRLARPAQSEDGQLIPRGSTVTVVAEGPSQLTVRSNQQN